MPEADQRSGTGAPGGSHLAGAPAGRTSSRDAVYIVGWRHGQSVWNAEGRWQGQADPVLSPLGEQQARRAARLVAALQPAAIYTSDLRRAADTAEQLVRITGLPAQADKGLRERGGGCWEGLTSAEIQARYPESWASWAPPDGEPPSAVADRVAEVIGRVADGLEAGSLAVLVSHGAALGMGMSRLLGLAEDARLLGALGNCSWSVLGRQGGRWRLLEHNVGTLPEPVPEPPTGNED